MGAASAMAKFRLPGRLVAGVVCGHQCSRRHRHCQNAGFLGERTRSVMVHWMMSCTVWGLGTVPPTVALCWTSWKNHPNGLYHLHMHLPPHRNNNKILTERVPKAKVKWTATIIGDDATSLSAEEIQWHGPEPGKTPVKRHSFKKVFSFSKN